MRVGATELLRKYGSPLRVAEALLQDRLNSFEQRFVADTVTPPILEAARIRVQQPTPDPVAVERERILKAFEELTSTMSPSDAYRPQFTALIEYFRKG